jgi:septum formation protein
MADIKIILASKSPRRQALIKALGFPFEIRTKEVEEIYPESLNVFSVPVYLAEFKAAPFVAALGPSEILLTSDTIVILNGKILGKPKGEEDAINMLKKLSGKIHEVLTGVCLRNSHKTYSFSVKTNVEFKELTNDEIEYYVHKFKPFDKAGSYGIQEWLGFIGVKNIDGCFYNVMGLPTNAIYTAIKKEFS